MTNEQLTAYLQDDSYLYAVGYEELKTLVMQYPYATNLRILLLKKSFLDKNKDFDRNLQMAATFTTNRKYLYHVVEKIKAFQAAPQSVILGEDYLELTELSNIEKLLAEKQVTDALGVNSKFDSLAADWQLEFGNLETSEDPKMKGRDAEEDEMFELAFNSQLTDNQTIENDDDLNFLIDNIVSEFSTPSVKTDFEADKSDFEFVDNKLELPNDAAVEALDLSAIFKEQPVETPANVVDLSALFEEEIEGNLISENEIDDLLINSFKSIKKETPDDLMANSFAFLNTGIEHELDNSMDYKFIDEKELINNNSEINNDLTKNKLINNPIETISKNIDNELVSDNFAINNNEINNELIDNSATNNNEIKDELIDNSIINKLASFSVIKRDATKETAAHSFQIVGKMLDVEASPMPVSTDLEENLLFIEEKGTPQYKNDLDATTTIFEEKIDDTTEIMGVKKSDLALEILNENKVTIAVKPTEEMPSEKLSFTEWLRQFRMNEATAKGQIAPSVAETTLPEIASNDAQVFDNQYIEEREETRKTIKESLDAIFETDNDIPENLFGLLDEPEKKPKKDADTEGYEDLIYQHLTAEIGDISTLSTEKKKKKKKKEMHELAIKSIEDDNDMVSETLADLLVWQGKTSKAVDMYQKLSLAFPDKSSYFAAKIETIRNSAT